MPNVVYTDSNGFIVAYNNDPGLSAGDGESLVVYNGTPINDIAHCKVDLGALPTVSIISKTAQEKADHDATLVLASSADVQTIYATKSTQDDKNAFFNALLKLLVDKDYKKQSVDAL